MRNVKSAAKWMHAAILGCSASVLLVATTPTRADDAPAKPIRPSARGQGITDEQVVQAMHKGIDFLLSSKKGDNFESGHAWPKSGQHGGETAIVLYALLNAGASLGDDPVYSAKLSEGGKELGPVISWLAQVDPQETYTAGLMASALTLLTKKPDEKPGTGPQAGLERDKFYLLSHMGVDGGYTYGFPGESATLSGFLPVFEQYYTAKTAPTPDAQAVKAAKAELDRFCRGLRETAGGPEIVVQHSAKELALKEAQARRAGDNATAQKIEAELRELEHFYSQDLPKDVIASTAEDLAKWEKYQAETERAIAAKDPSLAPPRYSGKTKTVRALAELPAFLEECKANVAKYGGQSSNHFSPLGDLSNGQYGTLGSWALCDYGIEYPMHYWQVQNRFWRMMQHPDGGWPYSTNPNAKDEQAVSKDTMTAAGVASLYVAEEFTDTEVRLIPKVDKALDGGVEWLSSKYEPTHSNLYYMYGVERVGLASGLKFLGPNHTINWYKEGAKGVISHQAGDGSWNFNGSQQVGTAYGLLFLARGRNPVVFNKLQYDGYWNARPRDDANITRWMSKQFEKPINWQIVNLQVNPDEWLDAPVLLITGSKDPKFTPADIDKLRTYVNAGGIIFSTADGQSIDFTKAMQKCAVELVHGQYEMKELPRNHPLFSRGLWKDAPNPPRMLAMSNGVRELWIHSTADMGASWQVKKTATAEHFTIPANLYFYATGKGSLRSKLSPLAVAPPTGAPARTISLARVEYTGNFDPEPGAWPRTVKLAAADFHTTLELSIVKIKDLDAKKNPIAHITGTSFSPGEADVKALKTYLDAGGFLFADAAGGKPEFVRGFYDAVKKMYPNATPARLPDDHPIITGKMTDGQPVGEAEFRKFARLQHANVLDLEAITVGGKVKIILSPYDITSGLLGTQTWGIVGYTPDTAETLVQNILLWAQSPASAPDQTVNTKPADSDSRIPALNLPSLK